MNIISFVILLPFLNIGHATSFSKKANPNYARALYYRKNIVEVKIIEIDHKKPEFKSTSRKIVYKVLDVIKGDEKLKGRIMYSVYEYLDILTGKNPTDRSVLNFSKNDTIYLGFDNYDGINVHLPNLDIFSKIKRKDILREQKIVGEEIKKYLLNFPGLFRFKVIDRYSKSGAYYIKVEILSIYKGVLKAQEAPLEIKIKESQKLPYSISSVHVTGYSFNIKNKELSLLRINSYTVNHEIINRLGLNK